VVDLPGHDVLDAARRRVGLSVEGLWIRYFEIGGLASVLELDAFLQGALVPPRLERDVIAHALNEAFSDKKLEERVGYMFPDDLN
jgi:hypothetical protein